MPLTKASGAVFERDKGIVPFPDFRYDARLRNCPFSHFDWPDHIVPVSRGGTTRRQSCLRVVSIQQQEGQQRPRQNYLFRDGWRRSISSGRTAS